MPRPRLDDGEYSLVAVQPGHIEAIRQWRNAQLDVLRQTAPLTPEQQQAYYAQHIWPTMDSPTPANLLLSFLHRDTPIGYGGLVHIAWHDRRAEVSFLLAPGLATDDTTYPTHFQHFLGLLKQLAFDDLGLHRLSTECYAIRPLHIATLEHSGFVREGVLRDQVWIDGRPVDAVVHGCLASDPRDTTTATATPPLKVLVSSAAHKVPLLRAVQAAARRLDPAACVVAGDLRADTLTAYVADASWAMPPADDDHLGEIVDGCRMRGIRVVLPTRDGELAFWARHADRFVDAGIAVIVSPEASLARCLDKLAFAEFGAMHGLPVISTATDLAALSCDRYVVKERFGAGSRALGLNLDREQALAHARALTTPIFQPYIQGEEFSADAWVDRHHRVKALVLRRRDLVVDGESRVTTTVSAPALEARLIAAIETLALRGPVVLQCLVDDVGALHLIECNPRFGGASTAGIAAGVDSLYWSLLESRGGDVDTEPFRRAADRICQIRVPCDLIRHDPSP